MNLRKLRRLEWIFRLISVPLLYTLFLVFLVESKFCALKQVRDKWCSEDIRWWNDCLAQPFNTLSNFALVSTLWSVILTKRESSPLAWIYGLSGAYIGFTSTVYHGTNGRGISGSMDVASIPPHIAIVGRSLLHYRLRYQGWIEVLFWVLTEIVSHLVEFYNPEKDWRVIGIVFITTIVLVACMLIFVIIDQKRTYWRLRLSGVLIYLTVQLWLFLADYSTCRGIHGVQSHILSAIGSIGAFQLTTERYVT